MNYKSCIRGFLELVFVIILSLFIINFVGQRTRVVGRSMENTLHDGDNLIIDKISYRFFKPKRFEIIVLKYPQNMKKKFVKRIIGLPNEKIQIIGSDIYINDKKLKENFGKEKIKDAGIANKAIKLKNNEYFVLGDNRNNSTDSRSPDVGIIKFKLILGKIRFRIFPFNEVRIFP